MVFTAKTTTAIQEFLSDFKNWEQKKHAKQWLICLENIGYYHSIDETALSKGELYPIITNKKPRERKGASLPPSPEPKLNPA